MAPIRRYLRITKYSVLEIRVYLDNPALAETWLLREGNPALPRIIKAVRPLVLPKLREENERAKGRGKGKKGVKDEVKEDDFEVSIFLTDLSSRHSLLIKQKSFSDKARLKSNSAKLTNWLTSGTHDEPIRIREEDDDAQIPLEAIPEAPSRSAAAEGETSTRPSRSGKRQRQDSDDALFVQSSGSDDDEFQRQSTPTSKRRRALDTVEDEVPEDDKKKLAMNTLYDGFSIYGRILCLVVKRRGIQGSSGAPGSSGQQMLENWVSTQAAQEQVGHDDDG